jgi:hypothetical protein
MRDALRSSCYMRYCDCAAGVLLLQVIFGKFTSRNCPQCFGTGPSDQGGTRHGGSAAWISRTSVFVWSDLENPCELQLVIRARLAGGIREQSNAGGIRGLVEQHHFIASQDGGGGFSEGLGMSRRRRVIQGPDTSSRGRLQVQGRDTSSRSLFLFRRRCFFSFSIHRTRHYAHFDTSPPGAFGRNGSHGESTRPDVAELGLLRAHWLIGPPFLDRKSLATMSSAGGVGG